MSLLKKMMTLSVYSLIIILIFNFLLKLNPSLSLSLNIIDHHYQKDDTMEHEETIHSLERNLEKESQDGDGYLHIPLKNMRQIRIKNLYRLNEPERSERMEFYKGVITRKVPVFEDQETVQRLESTLLLRGLWAICDWKFGMPPPFDKDKQCTETELKYILENSDDLMEPRDIGSSESTLEEAIAAAN